MALGWPVGEVLGSEGDLLERYQVSRPCSVRPCGWWSTDRSPGPAVAPVAASSSPSRRWGRSSTPWCWIAPGRRPSRRYLRGPHHPRGDRLPAGVGADRRGRPGRAAALRGELSGRARERPPGAPRMVAAISRNGASSSSSTCSTGGTAVSPDWQRFGSSIAKETRDAHAMIAEAIMAGDAGWPATACARTCRPRPTSSLPLLDPPAPARHGGPYPVRSGQGCRDSGAQDHPGHRHRGMQPGELCGRSPSSSSGGVQPGSVARGGPAARTRSDRADAPGPGGGLVVDGAEHQRGHRDGRYLPATARYAFAQLAEPRTASRSPSPTWRSASTT